MIGVKLRISQIRVRVLAAALGITFGSLCISLQHLSAQDQKASGSLSLGKMADGKQWTIQNLNIDIVPSYCYDDAAKNCLQYGRLYTWESARRACQSLGASWRLPTDEEWRRMAKEYGGVSADSEDKGKSAYKALLTGGSSGFNAVLGGGRTEHGEYVRLEVHGFYWAASEIDHATGWSYNFGKGGLALHRQSGSEKQSAFSVRCIRD